MGCSFPSLVHCVSKDHCSNNVLRLPAPPTPILPCHYSRPLLQLEIYGGEYAINGLKAGMLYFVRVFAKNQMVGWGAPTVCTPVAMIPRGAPEVQANFLLLSSRFNLYHSFHGIQQWRVEQGVACTLDFASNSALRCRTKLGETSQSTYSICPCTSIRFAPGTSKHRSNSYWTPISLGDMVRRAWRYNCLQG